MNKVSPRNPTNVRVLWMLRLSLFHRLKMRERKPFFMLLPSNSFFYANFCICSWGFYYFLRTRRHMFTIFGCYGCISVFAIDPSPDVRIRLLLHCELPVSCIEFLVESVKQMYFVKCIWWTLVVWNLRILQYPVFILVMSCTRVLFLCDSWTNEAALFKNLDNANWKSNDRRELECFSRWIESLLILSFRLFSYASLPVSNIETCDVFSNLW